MMKEIPNHDGYFATEDGRIYSSKTKRHLKPSSNGSGYQHLVLRVNNKSVDRYVHRLVMEAFKGASDLEVNHIDGDKNNNNLSNLEYVSSSENKNHAIGCGLRATKEVCVEDSDGFGVWSPSQKGLIGVGGLIQQDITKLYTGARKTARGYRCIR